VFIARNIRHSYTHTPERRMELESPYQPLEQALVRICRDWSDIFNVMARAQRRIGHFRFTVYGHLIAFSDESPVHHTRVKVRPMFAAAAMAAHRNRFPQFICSLKEPLAPGKGVRSEVRAQAPGHHRNGMHGR